MGYTQLDLFILEFIRSKLHIPENQVHYFGYPAMYNHSLKNLTVRMAKFISEYL